MCLLGLKSSNTEVEPCALKRALEAWIKRFKHFLETEMNVKPSINNSASDSLEASKELEPRNSKLVVRGVGKRAALPERKEVVKLLVMAYSLGWAEGSPHVEPVALLQGRASIGRRGNYPRLLWHFNLEFGSK